MAMLAFGAKTSLEAVLDKIADRVGPTGSDLFETERVLITLADDLDFDDNPISDSFLVISPKQFSAIEGMVMGGGNYECGHDGVIGIDLWNRYETDEILRDREALRNASYGLLAKWREVMTSLQLHKPLDSSGKCILIEPMRFIGWQIPARRPKTSWLVIKSQWNCKFVQDLGV